MEYFLGPQGVLFSNDIDIKIHIDLLFNDFKSYYVVFFFFSGLGSGSRLVLQAIYDVSDLFILKHDLYEISLLGPILKAFELLSFTFAILILGSYFMRKVKKNISLLLSMYIPGLIT